VRLVKGPLGPQLADHATHAAGGDLTSGCCEGEARDGRDDADGED
jgi:hypothetical protein